MFCKISSIRLDYLYVAHSHVAATATLCHSFNSFTLFFFVVVDVAVVVSPVIMYVEARATIRRTPLRPSVRGVAVAVTVQIFECGFKSKATTLYVILLLICLKPANSRVC